MSFEDKHVVVTGGNGNLGRSLVREALRLGARVTSLDLRAGEAVPGDGRADRYALDLCDADAVAACFSGLGHVDVLFNVAGGFAMDEGVHRIEPSAFRRLFDGNVATLLNCTAAVVPGMRERGAGKIVNVGAMSAASGLAHMGSYCAAKAAVVRLTESLSRELRAFGINVNCVLPSIIDTPDNRRAMPDADHASWVAPADLANVMCFLAGEGARAIHGAAVPVVNRV